MNTWRLALLAAATSLMLAGAAGAQEQPVKEPAEPAAPEDVAQVDEPGPDIAFNAGVSTDYVFRGISQTSENGQIFAGADIAFSGIGYAGVWASNIDYDYFGDDDTSAEVDFYAGVKPEAYGYVFDFAGIYYSYYGQPDNAAELNFFEVKAAASRAVGPATLGAAAYYSPEFSGELGDALYYEVNGSFTANDRLSFSGVLGRQTFNDIDDADYTTWNVGATIALTDRLALDLRYHDTDEGDLNEAYEGRAVASLKASF